MPKFSSLASAAVAAVLISLIAAQPAWAWGSDGHRMINRLAAANLPTDVPVFLRTPSALDTMEYLGPEPDRWRNRAEDELSQTQAADHFIDLEYADLAGPLSNLKKRYDFIRALSAAQSAHPDIQLTAEKVGLQPWQTEEVWQRLKVDFREYRKLLAAHQNTQPVETAILFDAGWLGHYVADGSQPLHTTIQYNGWTGPNPNGYTTAHKIHSQFETVYVSANVKAADIAPLVAAAKPQVIADEWTQYLAYLHHTNSLVEKTYQLEKAGGFNDAGTPAGKAFVDERIAAGAIELRDMIYSAWIHSADPVEEFHGAQ
ncbi:MAG: nuclease [Acidobacteriota bacterium]|nr:nuclease [Acidobacteriota bacterium]